MDETAAEPGSLTASVRRRRLPEGRRAAAASRACSPQAALVRASGADVYLASTFDGPLGIAAAVHCAAALRPSAACGLGTLALFADELESFRVDGGRDRRARRRPGSASDPAPRGAVTRCPDRRRHRLRRLARQAVAGARHDEQARARERPRDAPPEGGVAPVALAGDDRDGQPGELAEPVPQRLHDAGADAAQDGGERDRVVAQQIGAPERERARRRAGEQRLAAPALGELLDRAALGVGGEALVGGAALGPQRGVLDPGRARDEHEPRDALRMRERDVQRDPAAERVAAQHEALGRLRERRPRRTRRT